MTWLTVGSPERTGTERRSGESSRTSEEALVKRRDARPRRMVVNTMHEEWKRKGRKMAYKGSRDIV